jgi:hypothetical protein
VELAVGADAVEVAAEEAVEVKRLPSPSARYQLVEGSPRHSPTDMRFQPAAKAVVIIYSVRLFAVWLWMS